VLIGINLLREGLDLPEVSLVAILDADKEGFLRSAGSLIQTMGRARGICRESDSVCGPADESMRGDGRNGPEAGDPVASTTRNTGLHRNRS
jgi:hypothetical protein